MKNILIRCDASKDIGLGHVVRCLVIAKQLKKCGFKIIFAMKEELGIQKVTEKNFDIEVASKEDYKIWIKKVAKKNSIDIFIGDIRDGLPISLIVDLKDMNILTVAIDEPSKYAKQCDLVFFSPHVDIDKSIYKGKVYKGLEYIPLREEFYEPVEKTKNIIPNILIMLGGTDAKNFTFDVVKKIIDTTFKVKLKIVLPKNHRDYKKIKKFNKNIELFSNIDNMAKFLKNIDFSIITFGMSAYEMLFSGIKSIHICLNEDHKNASSWFSYNKYAISVSPENFTFNSDIINYKKSDVFLKSKKSLLIQKICEELNEKNS